MLGLANELEHRLETSAPLGAHHLRLPAAALLFQHFVQRHALAAALVDDFNYFRKNFLRAAHSVGLYFDPDYFRAKFATAIYPRTQSGFTVLARDRERFAANGALVLCVRRKHR